MSAALSVLGKVVIAMALPAKGKEEATDLLNKKILLFVRSSAATPSDVVAADMGRGFDSKQDMGDDAAWPSAGGARKIAVTLAEAIIPLLGPAR
jgi:hypothetical protein